MALRIDAEEGAAAGVVAEFAAIGADEGPRPAGIFADAEVDVAVVVDGQAIEAIVGMGGFGFEMGEGDFPGGGVVPVDVDQPENVVARRYNHRPIALGDEVHEKVLALIKRGDVIGLAAAGGVGEDANAIGRRPLVFLRPEVRVRFDDHEPAVPIDGCADWRDDVGLRPRRGDFRGGVLRDGVVAEVRPRHMRRTRRESPPRWR